MATDLAKLVVSMEANTAKFQKDMERVEQRLGRFEKNARSNLEKLGRAFVALGVGAGAREAVKFADAIGDTAKKAGLAARAYQELRYAASQLDVDTAQLDAALIRFNKTLGDARLGSKEAAQAFTHLGIDPAQFKSADEAFLAVTQKLGRVEDEFVRASLRAKIFGKEAGPNLAEFLGAGTDEIERLRGEAHAVGAVLSDDVIAKADKAQKQFDSLAAITRTQLTVAFVELAPVVTTLGEAAAKSAKGWGLLAQVIAETVRSARTFMADPPKINVAHAKKVEELQKVYAELNLAIARVENRGGDSSVSIIRTLSRRRDEVKRELDALRGQSNKPAEATSPPAGGDVPPVKPKVIAKTKEQIELVSDHARELERAREEVLLLNDAEGQEAQMRALVNELYEQGKIPQADYLAYLEEAGDRLTILAEEADEAESKTNIFADQAARNIQSFTASLVDAALAGGDMGDAIIASLRRIAAELLTTSLVTGAFTMLGIPGKASGGPVKGGMPYVVGEEGPELFVPRNSGTIVPNDAMGGGSKIEVTNNIDARGATGEAIAALARVAPAMAAQIESKIAEGLARGSYRVRSA